MESPANSQVISHFDAIFLSPHLDDAALSCGGTIHRLTSSGQRVLVVTVMAGDASSAVLSPFAESLHQRWQLKSGDLTDRRQEDIDACTVLKAQWLHWDIPDCIYRVDSTGKRPLYDSEESLFSEVNPLETDLINRIVHLMTALPDTEKIFIPLGMGHHVDHQLTRIAAEQWKKPSSFAYYEEYPYAESSVAAHVPLELTASWQSEVISLEQADIVVKTQAIACYKSQLSTFYDGQEDMIDSVTRYVTSVGGERFWASKEEYFESLA
jgi:LmbE family N-acetylglucosaminyl deacetylase